MVLRRSTSAVSNCEEWANVASSVCLLALLDVTSFCVNYETDGRVRSLLFGAM